MTTILAALAGSRPMPPLLKKKRVLLVDVSAVKRDLRAEAMRKLGVDVDSACDISEARCWWKAELYDLVIMNVENESGTRDKFCEDVRGATPPQQLVFLVGKPGYYSDSPGRGAADAAELTPEKEIEGLAAGVLASALPVKWGIMEASRRISAVRSVSAARTTALRNRPTPPRDREGRDSIRDEVMSRLVTELQKEELL